MKISTIGKTLLFVSATCFAQAQIYVVNVIGNQLPLVSDVRTQLTFTFTPEDLMTVFIDNTIASPNGVKGTFMGFGFNAASTSLDLSLLSVVSQIRGNNTALDWSVFAPYDLNPDINYSREFGAAPGNTPGGGNPHEGIAFGSTATIQFRFTPGYGPVVPADFFGTGINQISGRWQELTGPGIGSNNNSDKGLGTPTLQPPSGPPITPVPEASTYGLLGVSALMAAIVARRRRLKVSPTGA